MHELAICQALIEQVEVIARSHSSHKIICIKIALGPLAGVDSGLLERAFSIARAGSLATEATLVITTLPIKVSCQQCQAISEVSINKLVCNHCGNWHTQLVSGDEMLLSQVELDMAN